MNIHHVASIEMDSIWLDELDNIVGEALSINLGKALKRDDFELINEPIISFSNLRC